MSTIYSQYPLFWYLCKTALFDRKDSVCKVQSFCLSIFLRNVCNQQPPLAKNSASKRVDGENQTETVKPFYTKSENISFVSRFRSRLWSFSIPILCTLYYSKMAANKLFFCLHVNCHLRLIFTSKFFCFLCMLTRRRGLINMQAKE